MRTPPPAEERRRAPRFQIDSGEMAGLPVAASVQILDISLSGVLVESSQPTRQGARGHLRVDLGGAPLSADVEIQRVSSEEGTDRYRIGASFVNLSPEQQQLIGRFTTR